MMRVMSSKKVLITAVGDTTCSDDAKRTFENIAKLNPSINLFLGDSSYDNNSAKCFTDIISENNLKDITMISLGNHDDKEEHAPKVREQLIKYFKIPSDILLTKTFGNVLIISMNSQDDDWDLKNESQYKWVVEKLKEAEKLRDIDKRIDWIFVLIHKPLYTLKASHKPERKARDLYQPLFDEYQVDIVLHGHNHNQQRTKPIRYGGLDSKPVITSDASPIMIFRKSMDRYILLAGREEETSINLQNLKINGQSSRRTTPMDIIY